MCCLDFDDMFHILEVKLCDFHNWLQENLSPQIELLEVEHSCCFFLYKFGESINKGILETCNVIIQVCGVY